MEPERHDARAQHDRQPSRCRLPRPRPFLLVAHFAARTPTRPLRAVSSQPGSWAVAPAAYHTVFGYAGARTFTGPGGGTVTVDYGLGSGVLSGAWSETYTNYSDNGRDFVNGIVTHHGVRSRRR